MITLETPDVRYRDSFLALLKNVPFIRMKILQDSGVILRRPDRKEPLILRLLRQTVQMFMPAAMLGYGDVLVRNCG